MAADMAALILERLNRRFDPFRYLEELLRGVDLPEDLEKRIKWLLEFKATSSYYYNKFKWVQNHWLDCYKSYYDFADQPSNYFVFTRQTEARKSSPPLWQETLATGSYLEYLKYQSLKFNKLCVFVLQEIVYLLNHNGKFSDPNHADAAGAAGDRSNSPDAAAGPTIEQ